MAEKPKISVVPEKDVAIKKKEEKKEVKKPSLRPKLEEIRIVSEKEIKPAIVKVTPTGPRPVIPKTDDCCAKVCKILNDTIYGLEQALDIREEERALQELYIGTEKTEEREIVTILPPGIGHEAFGAKPEVVERAKGGKRRRLIIGGAVTAKQIKAIKGKLSTLKDFRFDLVNKGSCKCVEEIPLTPVRIKKP